MVTTTSPTHIDIVPLVIPPVEAESAAVPKPTAGRFAFTLTLAACAFVAVEFPHFDLSARILVTALAVASAGLVSSRAFGCRDLGWAASCLLTGAFAARVGPAAGVPVLAAGLMLSTWWLPRLAILNVPLAAAGMTVLAGHALHGPLYHIGNDMAGALNALGRALGATGTYGPTYLGLPHLGYLLVVVALLVMSARVPIKKAVALLLGITAGWSGLFLGLNEFISTQGPWIELTARHHVPLTGSGFVFLLPILLSLTAVASGGAAMFRFAALAETRARKPHRASIIATGVVSAIALFAALLGGAKRAAPMPIAIYSKGLVDFGVPQDGVYGVANTGMFGLWLARLRASGHEVTMVDEIGASAIAAAKALVLTNPSSLAPGAPDALARFVSDGGLLVVLGDHTNIEGTQDVINQALAPFDAWLRFDSAMPIGSNYRSIWRYSPEMHAAGVSEDNSMLRFGLGGSFTLSSRSWQPWIVMKHAFSDIGNRANAPSYLGDKQYSHGELYGDLVVAAARTYGKGRVVIFGDTSSFQNLAVLRSERLVTDAIFLWPHQAGAAGRIAVLMCLIATTALLAGWRVRLAAATLLAGAVACAAPGYQQRRGASREAVANAEPTVMVDVAKAEAISLQSFRRSSVDGLVVSGVRAGFWVRYLDSWRMLDEANSKNVFVCIAPRAAISGAEADRLERFLQRGGTAIVAAGYDSVSSLKRVTERFGFTISDSLLGPVPIREKLDTGAFLATRAELQMKEAWLLELREPESWDQSLSIGGHRVMASKRVGEGRLLVISDGRFLLDENLEGEKEGWEGNIQVLRKFLQEGRLP